MLPRSNLHISQLFRIAFALTASALCLGAFGQMAPPSHRDATDAIPNIGSHPELLTVLDLRKASTAEQILARSVQGLLNANIASFVTDDKIYLIVNEGDAQWPDFLVKRQYVLSAASIDDMDALLRRYPNHDAVLVDEQYANVGALVAGCDELLLVTDPSLVHKYGLSVREDLRGKWQNDLEAHRWVLDHYRNKINRRIVAMVPDQSPALDLMDYQIANKVFSFALAGNADDDEMLRTIGTQFDANIPCITRQFQNQQPVVDALSREAKFILPTAGLSNLSVWTTFTPYQPGLQETNSGATAQPRNSYQDPNGLKMGGWLGDDNRNSKMNLPWLRELAPPLFDGWARERNGGLVVDRDAFRFGVVNEQVYGAAFGDDRERLWTDYLHLSRSLLDLASNH